MTTHQVVENVDQQRFELLADGELVSYAIYDNREGVVVVPHVETVPQHRGNGNAARLMDGVLAMLRADGRRILPLCSFAAGHIAGNPQHHDLLARR